MLNLEWICVLFLCKFKVVFKNLDFYICYFFILGIGKEVNKIGMIMWLENRIKEWLFFSKILYYDIVLFDIDLVYLSFFKWFDIKMYI